MPPLRRKIPLFCLAIALSLSYCHPRSTNTSPVDRSFYYWRSVYSLTGRERDYLRTLKITRLYIRFFDVTWDAAQNRPTPTAPIRFRDTSYKVYSIIPVIFITNEVLNKLDTGEIPALAKNIANLTTQLRTTAQIQIPVEMQIDADWTPTTRERYFTLLKTIRQWLNTHEERSVQLSATIRLYQCKYRDLAGIPPVDRGLLMCYNMGDLKNLQAHNSIIDPGVLEKYTTRLPAYPLPLDVAFPIFNWKVYFHEGRYAGLMESLPTTELTKAQKRENLYTFTSDTTLAGYQFHEGDQLRDEQSDYDAIQITAGLVARQLKTPPKTVILFHLDSTNLANYTPDELENIFAHFN